MIITEKSIFGNSGKLLYNIFGDEGQGRRCLIVYGFCHLDVRL